MKSIVTINMKERFSISNRLLILEDIRVFGFPSKKIVVCIKIISVNSFHDNGIEYCIQLSFIDFIGMDL